jgi:hypothetical protein
LHLSPNNCIASPVSKTHKRQFGSAFSIQKSKFTLTNSSNFSNIKSAKKLSEFIQPKKLLKKNKSHNNIKLAVNRTAEENYVSAGDKMHNIDFNSQNNYSSFVSNMLKNSDMPSQPNPAIKNFDFSSEEEHPFIVPRVGGILTDLRSDK